MWRSGRSRGRVLLGMAGAWDLRWRKFRPHQCPRCRFRSQEIDKDGKPRCCTQAEKKPFLIDESKRDCKFFEEGIPDFALPRMSSVSRS